MRSPLSGQNKRGSETPDRPPLQAGARRYAAAAPAAARAPDRPRRRCAAKKRDELAASESIELHTLPPEPQWQHSGLPSIKLGARCDAGFRSRLGRLGVKVGQSTISTRCPDYPP